jgi:hypothetical protein
MTTPEDYEKYLHPIRIIWMKMIVNQKVRIPHDTQMTAEASSARKFHFTTTYLGKTKDRESYLLITHRNPDYKDDDADPSSNPY